MKWILGDLHQSNVLTIFSLFFGSVGVGFALIGETQYAFLSLIVSAIAIIFNTRFVETFERTDAQAAFANELSVLSQLLVYGFLPGALLIKLAGTSVWAVFVMAIYILAVAIQLAHYNRVIEFQGHQVEGASLALPLEASALVLPVVGLLGYLIPLNIFSIIFAVVMVALAIAFVVRYPIPKLSSRWAFYLMAAALVIGVIQIILGSILPVAS